MLESNSDCAWDDASWEEAAQNVVGRLADIDDSCQYMGVFATPESLDNYMKTSWGNAVAEPNADGFVASYELRGPAGEYLGFVMLVTETVVL